MWIHQVGRERACMARFYCCRLPAAGTASHTMRPLNCSYTVASTPAISGFS